MKGGSVKEDIYGCVRKLDGWLLDCKLAMHANDFDKILKSMINDYGSRHNGMRKRSDVISLDWLKSCNKSC